MIEISKLPQTAGNNECYLLTNSITKTENVLYKEELIAIYKYVQDNLKPYKYEIKLP